MIKLLESSLSAVIPGLDAGNWFTGGR